MIIPKKLGMLLLSIWLIMTGLMQVGSLSIPFIPTIMPFLAMVAGVLILLGR